MSDVVEAVARALEAQCSPVAMGQGVDDTVRQQAAAMLRKQHGEIRSLHAHITYLSGLLHVEAARDGVTPTPASEAG